MPALAIFIPAKPQAIEQTRFTTQNEAVTVHKSRAVEDTRTKTFDALIQDSLVILQGPLNVSGQPQT